MAKNYWTLCCLSLIGTIIFAFLFVLGLVFMKKLFGEKRYSILLLLTCSCITFSLCLLNTNNFINCCKDYKYVAENTFIEETAIVVEFTVSRIDYDGNGERINSKPKFYLIDKDEYIVLNAKKVELNETYIIRYYPNTKICEIVTPID